jgi:CO/xanthine dehydrogenase FAD-binding subunit
MPIAHEYDYFKPKTLAETLALLERYGNDARCLAGGTDLIVHLKENVVRPKAVLDVKGITALSELTMRGDELRIGALVTFSEIIHSSEVKNHFPVLVEAAETVASVGVRNRATLVGNICSAVPSLDAGPALLIYDAHVVVEGRAGERSISIHDWFAGPKKTTRAADELVKWIVLKKPSAKHASAYVKLGRYRGEDLAQAGVAAMLIEGNVYRVAVCALGPVAKRAAKVEVVLQGKPASESLFESAAQAVLGDISPISDIRSSKEYREHMAVVMTRRALSAAAARFSGKSVDAASILGG